jgi:ribosomal protein RSM22 (predicted rRNA methylase)
VEPGTPAGFKAVLDARQKVAGLLGPCPQDGACPMAAAPETKWCHFSARLERSRMARLMKGGDLGYEDEKFSYAIFSQFPAPRVAARIVGYPKKAEGRVSFELCGPAGLHVLDLKKNEKDIYKKAKKAEWGQPWPASAA